MNQPNIAAADTAASAREADLHAQIILAEQVRHLYLLSPQALVITVLLTVVFALFFWNHTNTTLFSIWLLCIAATTLGRYILVRRYHNTITADQDANLWARRFIMGTAAAGIVWGLLATALFPVDPRNQLLVVFLIGGVCAGAVPLLGAIKPAYLSFMLPSMLPLVGRVFHEGDDFAITVGLFLTVYIVSLILTLNKINHTILENLRTKFENIHLEKNLALMRQMEAVNRELKSEIQERQQAEDRTRHLAYHDTLTGLPNRLLLYDRICQAITHAQRHGTEFAVMFIDLDRFKTINDSLGHAIGDQVLQTVAERLVDCLRKEDSVARPGGDEFVVLLNDLHTDHGASHVAHTILQSLSQPVSINKQEFHITSSIGISLYPHDGTDMETLLKHADVAMYAAKEEGRDNYQFFTSAMNLRAKEYLSLQNNLHHALSRNELLLYYQPQFNLRSGTIASVEALLYWNHPEMGLVPPKKFIPVAEDTGLIIPIGEWVLRSAIRQVKQWQNAGHPELRAIINISVLQLRHADFISAVTNALRDADLAAKYLELEISESLLTKNPDRTANTLKALHDAGVSITVDDLGAGYSSMSYFKHFTIGRLKIDRSLVKDSGITSSSDNKIISAIIAMTHNLNLQVAAVGVETQEQLDCLRQLHCDEVQGYFLCRPLQAEQCAEFLSSHFQQPVRTL